MYGGLYWDINLFSLHFLSKLDKQLSLEQLAELDEYESERRSMETKKKEMQQQLLLEQAKENAQQAESRAEVLMEESKQLQQQIAQEWIVEQDKDTGKMFYISTKTGTSQWETPDVFIQAQQVEAAVAAATEIAHVQSLERDQALEALEQARVASRDAEVAAVRVMDAVSARLTWREFNQKVIQLQHQVDQWLVELDIHKGTEQHAATTLQDVAHSFKMANANAQVWEKKTLWNQVMDEASGDYFYVNAGKCQFILSFTG